MVTLLVSLFFTVEIGLLAGVCTNILHLALMWSRPKLKIELTKVSFSASFLRAMVVNIGTVKPCFDFSPKKWSLC